MITNAEKYLSTWTPEGRDTLARILRPIVERARAARLANEIEAQEMFKPWARSHVEEQQVAQ